MVVCAIFPDSPADRFPSYSVSVVALCSADMLANLIISVSGTIPVSRKEAGTRIPNSSLLIIEVSLLPEFKTLALSKRVPCPTGRLNRSKKKKDARTHRYTHRRAESS